MMRENRYFAGRLLLPGFYGAYANLHEKEIDLNVKAGKLGALVLAAGLAFAPLAGEPANKSIALLFAGAGGLMGAIGVAQTQILKRKKNLVLEARAMAWGLGSDKDRRNNDPTPIEYHTFDLRRMPMVEAVQIATKPSQYRI